ncbi:MAG: dihydroorotate dehydrogenase [Phycisphaerales bacterium]|nr:dihydroorotate dehydrogenase [Phycisphaerales bacterium]
MSEAQTNLATNLGGVLLRNPVVLAAGTCGYVDEMADVIDLSRIGAVTTKSITAEPREGNRPWRILDAPAGMLNAIGLANMGLEAFVRDQLPRAASCPATVIGSVAGNSIADYVSIASAFDASPHIPAIELNVSCPNTADGLVFGEDPQSLRNLLAEVRPAVTRSKLIVKLSPNAPSIVKMAQAAIDGGAEALTLINTFTALAIDVHTRKPRIANGTAGYSGPAIHPIAVRMVRDVYRSAARPAGVPIIGLGGVMRWEDAAEFILAGATAVGMGTALFVDPKLPLRVVAGLGRWVSSQGCASVSELIGQVEM